MATPFTYISVGASGYSGFSGNSTSGYSGYLGVSGFSGFTGVSGYSGYSSYSGYTGISGFTGVSGYSGYTGTSGYSGISGWSGISGYSGFSGAFAGTGTTNYVPKFTGASSLGNSAIYDSGLNVLGSPGVTVRAPLSAYFAYNVTPTLSAYTNGAFTINNANVELAFGADSSSPYEAYIQARAAGAAWPLSLNPLGGNVGIGTGSPKNALDINGNISVNGNAGLFSNGYYNSGFYYFGSGYAGYIYQSIITGAFSIQCSNGYGSANASASMNTLVNITSAGNMNVSGNVFTVSTSSPAAWGVNYFANQISLAAYAYSNNNGSTFVGNNVYYNSSNAATYINSSSFAAGQYTIASGAHYWYTAPAGTGGSACTLTSRMQLSNAGGLSVGTTSDPGAGAIYATGNITAYYSDDRLKTKLGKIENALDKICSLEGFYYEANETAQALGYKPVREVGISAQATQKVLPEIVAPAPISDEYLTIRYERLAPLLIEAIKELREEIKALK